MVELLTHDGVVDDEAALARWRSLVERDPLGTFFSTPEYLSTWARTLGTRASLRVHEVRDGDETIGVVPVALQREGAPTGPLEIVRFQGGTEVTDYLGPVSDPDRRDDVARAYADRLAADADWDEFVAAGLVEGSGWDEAWTAALTDVGLRNVAREPEDVCPRVDLSDGYGGWLSSLSGRQRQELKRKTRKLARDAGDLELVRVPDAGLSDALERFFALNVDQGDDKARFFASDDKRDWFRALADEHAGSGVFRLHELHAGGFPAAACVSLVHGGEWGLYNSAYDAALGMLSPGIVIVGLLLEEAAEEGVEVFDLLRGDEEYKYRFAPVDRVLTSTTWARE